jgi:hypothetical protein
LLRRILDESSDFIGLLDLDGHPLDMNAGARHLVGLPADAENAVNLGALDLMRGAAALETAIKDQAPHQESGLADLERQLHALATARTPWLATAERPGEARAAAPPTGPAAPLDPARLADLRLALQRQDLAAMDLFEALEPSLRDAWGEAATQALGEAIADLRFDAALAGMAGTGSIVKADTPGAGDPPPSPSLR